MGQFDLELDLKTIDSMISSRVLVILSGKVDPYHYRQVTEELIQLLKKRYYQVSIPIKGETK